MISSALVVLAMICTSQVFITQNGQKYDQNTVFFWCSPNVSENGSDHKSECLVKTSKYLSRFELNICWPKPGIPIWDHHLFLRNLLAYQEKRSMSASETLLQLRDFYFSTVREDKRSTVVINFIDK